VVSRLSETPLFKLKDMHFSASLSLALNSDRLSFDLQALKEAIEVFCSKNIPGLTSVEWLSKSLEELLLEKRVHMFSDQDFENNVMKVIFWNHFESLTVKKVFRLLSLLKIS
jgi:hypothetical protein